MRQKRVYLCDGSVDGIFTAIYEAFASRYGHADIAIAEADTGSNLELFTEYIEIVSDEEKARKVAESIKSKISLRAYEAVIKSALSKYKGKSDAVYRFLQVGYQARAAVLDQLSHPYVFPVFEIERNVNNETHHYLEFVRFSELKSGILVSKIRPENDVLSLIAPHFADRLPEENWIIYDQGRNTAALHRKDFPWMLADGSGIDQRELEEFSEEEHRMQLFWQTFVDTIAIRERANGKLQSQFLPDRYREFMREVPYKKGRKIKK